MQPVIAAVGFEAALQLVKAHGGLSIYVSAQPRPTDAVASCIGLEMARALARAIGPGQLEVPRCVSWLAALRRQEVQAARAAGVTVVELSRRYGFTQRHIRNLLRELQHEQEMTT